MVELNARVKKKKKRKDHRDPSREYSPFKFGTHQESINGSFISTWRGANSRKDEEKRDNSEAR